jgi:hypothetical protein
MTKPCNVCGEEIDFKKDPVTGKAYPVNPATGTRHECKKGGTNTPGTSPSTPVAATPSDNGLPKTLEGKVVNLNPSARTFTLRPDGAFAVDIVWGAHQDSAMQKYKDGYKAKVTYEPGTPNRMVDIISLFKKRENGGYGGQPRNDKAIILQCCMKVAADVYIARNHNAPTFEDAMEDITEEAVKAAGELCKQAGVN